MKCGKEQVSPDQATASLSEQTKALEQLKRN